MTLKNNLELANTREKLRELQVRYEVRCKETVPKPHVHELTLQSLKRLISQLTKEISRYEAQQTA